MGDLEYYFTADIDAPYYGVQDYAFNYGHEVGYGAGWSEQITAVTNRATYASTEGVPSGGTDYFVRIREGESNMEWVQLVGELTYTNKTTWSSEVVTNKIASRMTLVGDHSWRYHYEVPTNAVGGKLSFHLVTKEHYTNATDATTWYVRTNVLYTVEDTVPEIPYTATLKTSNRNDVSLILDDSSTHLKIEYNDEQGAFSLSHASYQAFNLWTDARNGFRGNMMDANGVSNSGVSGNKRRYDAPFDNTWELCPETKPYWLENFSKGARPDSDFPLNKWFSTHGTPNGWTMHNGQFVEGARGDSQNLALSMNGLGEGAVALEEFSKDELPLGLDTVEFTARIAQPIQYDDFATYKDGFSCSNYAISAKITMSRQYEAGMVKPTDMSPVYPSVSFVGYHRGKKGCYEFRMTRTTDTALTLALYKWESSGSSTKPRLLTSKNYTGNLLVPNSRDQSTGSYWTSAYFLVYTMPVTGYVKLEGHLASSRSQNSVTTEGSAALGTSVISCVDRDPGEFAKGGSYGVGSTDCRAGFGQISIHSVNTPPTETVDAAINYSGAPVKDKLDDWDYYESRWEIDTESRYQNDGSLSAVIPSNQVVEVWLCDATKPGNESDGWFYTGYDVAVNSFSTNKFSVSPRITGVWKVRLQTGEEEDAGVVVDDVEVTPWEGVERWGRKGSYDDPDYLNEWVYTKAWIDTAAAITRDGEPYYLPQDNVTPAGTNTYAFIFNEPGDYYFTPTAEMEVERILVVGGGGSGGSTMGGGGGGGGVIERNLEDNPVTIKTNATIRIRVGKGGAAPVPVYSSGNANATSQPAGLNGEDSIVSGITGQGTLTAKGGGGGSGWSVAAKSGGSGGGGANARAGAGGTTNQGHAGGQAVTGSSNSYGLGGGGGGGGAAGQNGQGASVTGGKGGDGWQSDITGKICYYGGGGGGGAGWKTSALGGAGGMCGPATSAMTAGHGADYQKEATTLTAGLDGYGGGGGGGTYYNNSNDANVKKGAGAKGGCGTVILRVRAAPRVCVLQPSRGWMKEESGVRYPYPMGLRSPYINEGMSLFSFSYKNADSNCVLLVQIATNMSPSTSASTYVPDLTESIATNGGDQVWTTVKRFDFRDATPNDLAGGTRTAFLGLRQHTIYDSRARKDVYTNVCGVIRVIVDPDIVSNVVNAAADVRDDLVNYGKITLTKAFCYNEPALNLRSWFGWNVYTEGWDGAGGAGRFSYLTDWPDGLSIALNFSALETDNDPGLPSTLGVGLSETDPTEVQQYAQQNPFIQCAALTNGIGTVSFRARLFDTNAPNHRAVITLYGGTQPDYDQTRADDLNVDSVRWDILTNFVVTTPTYQAFEWASPAAESEYQAIRLEAAGARWGRYPSTKAKAWEWGNLDVKQEPVNRVLIDEVSVSELIVPRLKFLDVRPFRSNLDSGAVCEITNIMSEAQQPLILESWGVQCRLEPQQMADELDTSSVRVWLEVYRGEKPWGYKQWKDQPKEIEVDGRTMRQRFTSELQRVTDSDLLYRSYYLFPESIIPPEEKPSTVYQYYVYATYKDKSGSGTVYTNKFEAADWKEPEWYRGSKIQGYNASGDPDQFSAYTILDSVSPYRAWINELNICDTMDKSELGFYQFLEFAVPQNANLKGWKIRAVTKNLDVVTLATFGTDSGVRACTNKFGVIYGVDNTNDYTFVSVCAPSVPISSRGQYDGYWKTISTNTITEGRLSYQHPYGIQLLRPSNIIEHEIVMQGTNKYADVAGAGTSGTNLLADLRAADGPKSTWFFVGDDPPTANTSLGVFRSHGENVDPSCWTNYMFCTPGTINQLKNGTRQEIPDGYFLVPNGGNIWIYSTLLKPHLMKQFSGGRDVGSSTVIVAPETLGSTNIVLVVTNWYQIGQCTTNGWEVPGARGRTGTYPLQIDFSVAKDNKINILIDAELDNTLASKWGLTPDNAYTPAVMDWLYNEYPGYKPEDLSNAIYRDLSGVSKIPLSLTEMYWLNIPPVHKADVYGGSNIWFIAGSGAWVATADTPSIEPEGVTMSDGSVRTNVYMTVTMMITNTSPLAAAPRAWPPDRLNGLVYDGQGSSAWTGGDPPWTGAVFNIVGALQKPGYGNKFLPLQQYTFKLDSFGAADDPQHAFQTRVKVMDPYASNSMGYNYDWGQYRNIYPIWYRWVIKPRPDDLRLSTVPLTPNWGDRP